MTYLRYPRLTLMKRSSRLAAFCETIDAREPFPFIPPPK